MRPDKTFGYYFAYLYLALQHFSFFLSEGIIHVHIILNSQNLENYVSLLSKSTVTLFSYINLISVALINFYIAKSDAPYISSFQPVHHTLNKFKFTLLQICRNLADWKKSSFTGFRGSSGEIRNVNTFVWSLLGYIY